MSNHLAYMRFLHGSPHLIPSGQLSFSDPGKVFVHSPSKTYGRAGLIAMDGAKIWLPTRPGEQRESSKILAVDYLGQGRFSITPYEDGLRVALDGEIKRLDVNAPFTLEAGKNHHSPTVRFHDHDEAMFTLEDVIRSGSVTGFTKNRLQKGGALYD